MEALAIHLALALSGAAAGFVNAFAGGGSLFSLPVLLLAGLPADVANGTNRVAVLAQSIAGFLAYRAEGRTTTFGAAWPLVVPTMLAALVGSAIAVRVPPAVLKPILLSSMIAMALVVALVPTSIGTEGEPPRGLRERPSGLVVLLLAGLYGGFLQAGVGFLLLFALGGVLRYDLARANALKLLVTTLFSVVTLAVFVAHDQVRWLEGLVLGVGTSVGAVLGARFASRVPARLVRVAVVVVVLVVSGVAWLR